MTIVKSARSASQAKTDAKTPSKRKASIVKNTTKTSSKRGVGAKKKANSQSSPSTLIDISNNGDYVRVMARLDVLMNKGSQNLTLDEFQEIRRLALMAQNYEQRVYTIRPPQTLVGILEMKMYEMKLKQKDLAKKLHVSDAKLSLIISGKQKPDVELIKSIHRVLNVDAELLLTLA